MRDKGKPPLRQRLLPWLALLSLVPITAMLLFVSHTGRIWLERAASRPEATAAIPGITMEAAPARKNKLVVTSIRSDGQAARQGVAVGDTIVAIDGKPIFTLDQARRYLQKDHAAAMQLRIVHARRARNVRLDRKGGQDEQQGTRRRG